MGKLIPQDGQSLNIIDENIAALQTIFPEAFTEGKVDFAVLRQLLGDAVDDGEEKYGLIWFGKKQARQIALTPSLGTLRPCPEESVAWDTTQNLFIEGDNLEVLKLLQKSYAGKVKMIYIDPPYNTGNEFIYPDKFQDNLETYLKYTGQIDDDDMTFSSNPESSGRYHTNWLNMMYSRLKLGKNLLRNDGVIFVSINDAEVQNLKATLNEIFGEENFISQIVWQRSKKGDAKTIANIHEYIVVYTKNKEKNLESDIWRKPKEGAAEVLAQYRKFKSELKGNHDLIREEMMAWYRQLPKNDARRSHKHYNWSDDRGLYFADNFAGPDDGRKNRPRHDIFHPVTGKSCKKPSTGWRWDEDKTNWALAQNPPRIHFGIDETTIPNRKSYLHEISTEPFSSVFYTDGRSATLEVENLVGKGVFPFPKNKEVISELVSLVCKSGDVVLDFFAGSGTTGHAIFHLGVENDKAISFILVQLPESCDPSSKASDAGFKTISEIGKERIRRAAAKIKAENPDYDGDLGFKVFKLDSSNIRAWNPDRSNLEQTLLDHKEHLVEGRSEQDVLYELLLKRGIELTVPIGEKTIAGKTVYSIGYGALFACLNATISRSDVEALAHGILAWHKELAPASDTQIVFRDSAFADDIAKTNMAAILEQNGISHVRSL